MQIAWRVPTRRCKTLPAFPFAALCHSTGSGDSNLPEFPCVELCADSFLYGSSGLGEYIVVPVGDIAPADLRVVVPQHAQEAKVKPAKLMRDYLRRCQVGLHTAMRGVRPIALPLPKSSRGYSSRGPAERLEHSLKT